MEARKAFPPECMSPASHEPSSYLLSIKGHLRNRRLHSPRPRPFTWARNNGKTDVTGGTNRRWKGSWYGDGSPLPYITGCPSLKDISFLSSFFQPPSLPCRPGEEEELGWGICLLHFLLFALVLLWQPRPLALSDCSLSSSFCCCSRPHRYILRVRRFLFKLIFVVNHGQIAASG